MYIVQVHRYIFPQVTTHMLSKTIIQNYHHRLRSNFLFEVSEVIDGNGMIVVEHLDYGTVSMVSWWDCHGLYKHLRHTPSRITARVPDSVPQVKFTPCPIIYLNQVYLSNIDIYKPVKLTQLGKCITRIIS